MLQFQSQNEAEQEKEAGNSDGLWICLLVWGNLDLNEKMLKYKRRQNQYEGYKTGVNVKVKVIVTLVNTDAILLIYVFFLNDTVVI